MTKPRFYVVLLWLVMVGVFFAGADINSQAIAAAEKPRIVAIFQVGFIDFFVPTRLGAEKAALECGADFKFMGPSGIYVFLYVVGEDVIPHEEFEKLYRK